MSETPNLSTLPDRMRYAAKVLGEASMHYHSLDTNRNSNWTCAFWSVSDLERQADEFEEADRRDLLVEELAIALFDHWGPGFYGGRWEQDTEESRSKYRTLARDLIDAGWTKAADR